MLLPEAMVMSGSMLPLRVMVGFMVLLQLEPVLMSMIHVTIKGHVDVHGLCFSLNPLRALSGSVVLLK